MHKLFKIVVMVLLINLNFFNCKAQDIVQINDLIEKSKEFNNKDVIIQGEVVGEKMIRGEYAWININDGSNVIGIWAKNADFKDIKDYGNYKNKGNLVKVEGTFSRNCMEHGGDVDIHAKKVTVTEQGSKIVRNIDKMKINACIILIILTSVLGFLYYKYIKVRTV